MNKFKPGCLPLLIGSLPIRDHEKARDLVFQYTPEIPLWVQLPAFKQEQMLEQFMPGLPGLVTTDGKTYVNTASDHFDNELLEFYENFMAVNDKKMDIKYSSFAMTPETARGFFVFKEYLKSLESLPKAVKGQITGPVTFCMTLSDENGKSIFYNDHVRDAAVKLLAMKARWQARQLREFGCQTIIFFDEPGLAGFGSSGFISITKEEIITILDEVIKAVKSEGALAGIHVCANADWSLIMDSPTDIVSFDAYEYFDTFILYPDRIKSFLDSGGIIAWGIVPTLSTEDIEKETTASLLSNWRQKVDQVEAYGINRHTLLSQSLITPACGTGSLSPENAEKVLKLTSEISKIIRFQEL
jgi:methionine synthase II (cobalamin-independent)